MYQKEKKRAGLYAAQLVCICGNVEWTKCMPQSSITSRCSKCFVKAHQGQTDCRACGAPQTVTNWVMLLSDQLNHVADMVLCGIAHCNGTTAEQRKGTLSIIIARQANTHIFQNPKWQLLLPQPLLKLWSYNTCHFYCPLIYLEFFETEHWQQVWMCFPLFVYQTY